MGAAAFIAVSGIWGYSVCCWCRNSLSLISMGSTCEGFGLMWYPVMLCALWLQGPLPDR